MTYEQWLQTDRTCQGVCVCVCVSLVTTSVTITGIIAATLTVTLTVAPTILFSQQSSHSKSLRDPSLLELKTSWTSCRFFLAHVALGYGTPLRPNLVALIGLGFGLILIHEVVLNRSSWNAIQGGSDDEQPLPQQRRRTSHEMRLRHTVWANHVRRARGARNVKAALAPAYDPQAAFVCQAAGAANHLRLKRASAQYTNIMTSPIRKGGRSSLRIHMFAEGPIVRRAQVRHVPPRVRHGSEWNQGRATNQLKHLSKNCCGLHEIMCDLVKIRCHEEQNCSYKI